MRHVDYPHVIPKSEAPPPLWLASTHPVALHARGSIAALMLRPERRQFGDVWWLYARTMVRTTDYYRPRLPNSACLYLRPRKCGGVCAITEQGGSSATGTYVCELYASPVSKFWMSRAYDGEVVKVDMFWFKKSKTDPHRDFYPQFWRLFKDLNDTLHATSTFVTDYCRHQLAITPAPAKRR